LISVNIYFYIFAHKRTLVGIKLSTSSLKSFIKDVIGDTAEGPNGQIVVIFGGQERPGEILSQTSSSRSISDARPLPEATLSNIISNHVVPSLHGVH